MRTIAALLLTLGFTLTGCSTTQDVTLAKRSVTGRYESIAQVAEAGNSEQMNGYLTAALQKSGLDVKSALPAGTTKAPDTGLLVSYVDVWRWDLAMYLKSLTVRLFDAETGDLLVLGQWTDSPMHGFRDSQAVMEGLVAEVLAKLRAGQQSPTK